MKILITGYKGFVGSHFHERLQNHDLTLVDIAEGNDAADFFRTNNDKFDLVIHLAATVGGRKVIDLEPSRLFNNFVLDSEMIQWALRTKPRKIVYYSSSAAYPMSLQSSHVWNDSRTGCHHRPNDRRLVETDINLNSVQNPDPSIYGWSKLTGEQLLSYVKNELNVWIFRPFSGYSEKQSLDYPFPSFIARAKRRDDPFEIWGDGNQVRDWVHIDDIVTFTLEAVDIADPDVFNICTGRPTSFNEFAEILTDAVGYKPKFNRILDAPVGVQYRVGDPSKQNMVYRPKITLEEGIARALKL
jgi:nucleoside-diphosphate-sugar epimerase